VISLSKGNQHKYISLCAAGNISGLRAEDRGYEYRMRGEKGLEETMALKGRQCPTTSDLEALAVTPG
jgi:hypothetical protein